MFKRIMPKSIEGQMMAVLAVSFSVLLGILALFEALEYDNVQEWAQSDFTISRLARIKPIMESIRAEEITSFTGKISRCHDGYRMSTEPYAFDFENDETKSIAGSVAKALGLSAGEVRAGFVQLDREDFSYDACPPSEIQFPIDGIVISMMIGPRQWLHAEVHPHEWHFTPTMRDWLVRSATAFILIGVVAILFVRRISKPINSLTGAARTFGTGLEVAEVAESGPPDVRRAIKSFNAMQRQVADEVDRRTNTLAAISHDVRSPLTALRVKAELVADEDMRQELIASIEKMERITATALDFLKGQSRNEPKRMTDIGALVESEVQDFIDAGAKVSFRCAASIQFLCRPDALARAIHNLIENAVKYAGSAHVEVFPDGNSIEIRVKDDGPGIEADKMDFAMKPFERISAARESDAGGYGLGLAIAQAVAEGHEGALILEANSPKGLKAILRLPR